MEILVYFFVFLFGSAIGSFLNVAAFRYNTGVFFRPRSFCFSCGKNLSWRENIPLLSFLRQRGRCRGCKSAISPQYFIVELATGILFLIVFLKEGLLIKTFFIWAIASILMVIAIYDIRHKIIPDGFAGLLAVTALLYSIFYAPLGEHLLAAFLLSAPLAAIFLFSKGTWMGLGDGKLMFGIGLFLGISEGAAALLLSFWIGAVAGIILLFAGRPGARRIFGKLFKKKMTLKSEIPFGPFLITGAFCAYFFNLGFFDLLFGPSLF